MTDHYEEFRPEEIDERLEQLLHLDDVEFPSSSLEHDVRVTKHLEQLFHESGSADKASVEEVGRKLYQQLQHKHVQAANNNIVPLPINATHYTKKDPRRMQNNPYRRKSRMIEVLVAICLLGVIGAGLLVFFNIYRHGQQATSPVATPTAVPVTPQATKPSTHSQVTTPTAVPQTRTCNDSTTPQQASPGTYLRYYDRLFKLDNQSGQIDWTFQLPDATSLLAFNTNPLLVGNTVYVSSYSGRIFALDAEKGTLLWTQQYPVYEYSPPTGGPGGGSLGSYSSIKSLQIDCGLLAFISSDENVHVLDASTGADVWHTNNARLNSSPEQSLVVGNGAVYYSSSIDAQVHAYNIVDGHELWSQALIASKLFIHIEKNMLYGPTQVLDTSDGHLLFDAAQIRNDSRIKKIVNTIVYVIPDVNSGLSAYDINTKSVLWQAKIGADIIDSRGHVFVHQLTNTDTTFIVLDSQSGQELWRKSLNWWMPDNLVDQALDTSDVLYLRDDNTMYGTSLDGQILWQYNYPLIGQASDMSFYNISDGGQWFYRFGADASGLHLTTINPQVGQVVWQQLIPKSQIPHSNPDPRYPIPSPQAPFSRDGFGIVTIV